MAKDKIYLDTNIVADVIDASRAGQKESIELLKKLVIEGCDICISEDMLSTLYYISKNKIATLEFFQNVIFEDWQILSFGKKIISDATRLSLEEDLDFEDILQCLCAKKSGCKVLITNDKRFYDCGMKICSVKEFLNRKIN